MTYELAKAGGNVYDRLGLRFLPLRSQVREGRTSIDLGNVRCVGSGWRRGKYHQVWAANAVKRGLMLTSFVCSRVLVLVLVVGVTPNRSWINLTLFHGLFSVGKLSAHVGSYG